MIRRGAARGAARSNIGQSASGHLIRFMAIVEAKSWLIELAKVSTIARTILCYDLILANKIAVKYWLIVMTVAIDSILVWYRVWIWRVSGEIRPYGRTTPWYKGRRGISHKDTPEGGIVIQAVVGGELHARGVVDMTRT